MELKTSLKGSENTPTPSLRQKLKPKTKTTFFFVPKLKPFFLGSRQKKGKRKPKTIWPWFWFWPWEG